MIDWLLGCLESAGKVAAAFQDPLILNALGLALIYAIIPLTSLVYAKVIRRARRKKGAPMDGLEFRGMLALLAGVPAMFFGHMLCGWPVAKAFVNAAFMAYLLPTLLPALLDRLEKVAPDIADDIGPLPTELRAVDTTEFTAGRPDE